MANTKDRLLHPNNESRYPLNRGLGGPQSSYGRFEEGKHLLPLLGFESPTVQPAAWARTKIIMKISKADSFKHKVH
jgi:hypothetical protein